MTSSLDPRSIDVIDVTGNVAFGVYRLLQRKEVVINRRLGGSETLLRIK